MQKRIHLTIDVVLINVRPDQVSYYDGTGTRILSTYRRIVPNLWKYQQQEVQDMIGITPPQDLVMSTSTLRWLLRDLVKNPKFVLKSLTRTFRFRIEELSIDQLSLSVNTQEANVRTWISRSCVAVGLKPTDLDESLEESRLKDPLSFGVMVRAVTGDSLLHSDIIYEERNLSLEPVVRLPSVESAFSIRHEVVSDAVVAHGKLVVSDNQVLELSNARSILSRRMPGVLVFKDSNYRLYKLNKYEYLDRAIFLGGSTNWFHFIVEYLSRIVALSDEERESRPVVLADDSPKNMQLLCRLITGVDPVLVKLGSGLVVGTLSVLREQGVIDPIDPIARQGNLTQLRRIVLNSFNSDTVFPSERLFLRRPPKLYRQLQNEEEVVDFLEGQGFVSIYPEKMSFLELLVLLQKAKFVVAESGAAITNMMFANSESKFLEITPAIVERDFWRRYVEIFGIEYFGIQGKKSKFGPKGYAFDGYNLNVEQLRKLIVPELS